MLYSVTVAGDVLLDIPFLYTNDDLDVANFVCQFWDFDIGNWSEVGCQVDSVTPSLVHFFSALCLCKLFHDGDQKCIDKSVNNR